ncbi:MAG TPA: bifunctional 2-polyprenyl-6-hydroxyphenol methylase/3-demethylubiquinol 3-O-methyltransferase UbiG [Roseiarcus sp.]|nr:bifunctional 2-polyprenyl-6-hydroxyphenol methylase/3-demethylubiquinol 3-O-methyltransferase UbiG [Roseiarcus sp.]
MSAASVKIDEVARFDALAQDWWNPDGPMAPLHAINPVRIGWLVDRLARRFRSQGQPPLEGLSILDIGCGAGLLSEPLSRLGAKVTGLDPAASAIAAARAHAEATGAELTYRAGTVEDLAAEGAQFDAVLAMEVVEHVEDVAGFIAAAASLVAPGGIFCLSTLNRTAKSFALAIVGAEYLLRWLPKGTHRWEQFVTPLELTGALRRAGFVVTARRGLVFDPLRRDWRLSDDMSVNYFLAAVARG